MQDQIEIVPRPKWFLPLLYLIWVVAFIALLDPSLYEYDYYENIFNKKFLVLILTSIACVLMFKGINLGRILYGASIGLVLRTILHTNTAEPFEIFYAVIWIITQVLCIVLLYNKKTTQYFKYKVSFNEANKLSDIPLARIHHRYLAIFIDNFFIFILLVISAKIIFPSYQAAQQHNIMAIFITAWIIILLSYVPVCTAKLCTLGQLMVGIRVRSLQLQKISLAKACWRFLVKSLLGWISFVTVFFDPNSRGIHDYAVDTIVVKHNSIKK